MNTSRVLLCVSRPHGSSFIRSVSHNLQILTSKMPKEVKHTAFLQKHRQKLKEKNQKYTPGTVNLKVLGSGAKGAARSLYIFSDQSRYMFNCGEGTQRQAHEHKMKLSKLEHIFITHNSWNNIGGLPGVALTIQDVGVPEITIHGPSGTVEIFNATSRFVILRDLNVKMADCSLGKYFEDNVMKVIYVPIISTSQRYKAKIDDVSGAVSDNFLKEQMEDDIDYYAHERKKKIVSSEKVQQKRQKIDSANDETPKQNMDAAMCYVCRLHPRPGALCLDKCVEKGVPPGPLLGKLKGGEDVVLADGTVVLSSDVRMPEDPGPVFIVVECPTVDYIDDLVNNSLIAQHQETALNDNDVASLVVHFTPQEVMNDLRYKNWMEKFSMSTQHLILNEENECMGSVAVHRVQYKLNLLHSGIFPLLGDESIRIDPKHALDDGFVGTQIKQSSEIPKAPLENGICSYRGRTFDCVHLRPRKLWERKEELFLTPKIFIDEVNEEGFSDTLCQLRKDIELVSSNIVLKDSDPRITFLGTGSCIPNKTRNTSGILLHTSETDSILLDCGEGTYGQIVRFFGPEKSDAVLLGIKAIYVSHLHADHHIGLIGILKARRRAIERRTALPQSIEPIFLLAPQQILSWLSLYHWNFESIMQEILLVPNGQLDLQHNTINEEGKKRILDVLNMADIATVRVRHCPNSFGVAFKHKNNWKLTYSGDTMPCTQLITLGKYSDVLIHEATMEDELEEEARIKLHSTTSQAIQIGQKMLAKFIILTHFSQRYAKIPLINENFSSNVGIAFDNMQVYFRELPFLPLMHTALKIMFAEHYDEMEQKTYRRLMRQERENKMVEEK